MGDELWRMPELDQFFAHRLGVSREGTDWEKGSAHSDHLPAFVSGFGMAVAPPLVWNHGVVGFAWCR